jgi:hypothetical protein
VVVQPGCLGGADPQGLESGFVGGAAEGGEVDRVIVDVEQHADAHGGWPPSLERLEIEIVLNSTQVC